MISGSDLCIFVDRLNAFSTILAPSLEARQSYGRREGGAYLKKKKVSNSFLYVQYMFMQRANKISVEKMGKNHVFKVLTKHFCP